jgi:hypothetical protein
MQPKPLRTQNPVSPSQAPWTFRMKALLIAVRREAQEELTVMTSMGEMAGVTRNEKPIGPGHVRVVIHDPIAYSQKRGGQNDL